MALRITIMIMMGMTKTIIMYRGPILSQALGTHFVLPYFLLRAALEGRYHNLSSEKGRSFQGQTKSKRWG